MNRRVVILAAVVSIFSPGTATACFPWACRRRTRTAVIFTGPFDDVRLIARPSNDNTSRLVYAHNYGRRAVTVVVRSRAYENGLPIGVIDREPFVVYPSGEEFVGGTNSGQATFTYQIVRAWY